MIGFEISLIECYQLRRNCDVAWICDMRAMTFWPAMFSILLHVHARLQCLPSTTSLSTSTVRMESTWPGLILANMKTSLSRWSTTHRLGQAMRLVAATLADTGASWPSFRRRFSIWLCVSPRSSDRRRDRQWSRISSCRVSTVSAQFNFVESFGPPPYFKLRDQDVVHTCCMPAYSLVRSLSACPSV